MADRHPNGSCVLVRGTSPESDDCARAGVVRWRALGGLQLALMCSFGVGDWHCRRVGVERPGSGAYSDPSWPCRRSRMRNNTGVSRARLPEQVEVQLVEALMGVRGAVPWGVSVVCA
ncbi:MAG: hypothetical protein ACYDEY_07625 [Acidimicrobiales bacterium]